MKQPADTAFDSTCRRCPRLAAHLDDVKRLYPDYHAAPVPAFGPKRARLIIVGLAPGLHGANATGRPFTGDFAGILLYKALHTEGFANQATAVSATDGLKLVDCRITNAVKCLPPQNKPIGSEVVTCNSYLRAELARAPRGAVILALGAIAHRAVLRAFDLRPANHPFGHANEYALEKHACRLLDSYHCSRYNTQTRRLTEGMFMAVMARARELINKS